MTCGATPEYASWNEATPQMIARIIRAARSLAREAGLLRFAAPVSFVYNPLDYARIPHETYLRKYSAAKKRIIFLGMNPGPWGMAQTGVPFGDVPSARDWLKISGVVNQPRRMHEKHPVEGFSCSRREVSGTRLWGLMQEHYGTTGAFARDAFVGNYCPLLFLDAAGRNLTPDKLRAKDRDRLEALCDRFLAEVIAALSPEWIVGIGVFAERRVRTVLGQMPGRSTRVGSIPHPSPASPRANRGWAGLARSALEAQGIWKR
jgi:single-strand selective monofunctional uracil DNA glycosylase